MTGGNARAQGESAAYMVLAALPTAPFCARRRARAVLQGWGMGSEIVETAELLVSELTTNAVKFTEQAQEPRWKHSSDLEGVERISLTLRYLTGQVMIEISDSDVNPPQMADADVNAESGRGLMLVDALSKEWSYFLRPSGGKTVYCVLSTDEPAHMPATKPEGGIHDR
jgi:anti-sigma regulatory factor (Ser/Thr protein kinase)